MWNSSRAFVWWSLYLLDSERAPRAFISLYKRRTNNEKAIAKCVSVNIQSLQTRIDFQMKDDEYFAHFLQSSNSTSKRFSCWQQNQRCLMKNNSSFLVFLLANTECWEITPNKESQFSISSHHPVQNGAFAVFLVDKNRAERRGVSEFSTPFHLSLLEPVDFGFVSCFRSTH